MRAPRSPKHLAMFWAVAFVIILVLAVGLLLLSRYTPGPGRSAFEAIDDAAAGTLTVMENGRPILTYRYGDELPAGLGTDLVRSCYVHPLHGLDGQVLTDDFPADHPHHHGLFWAWPWVKVGERTTQSWHPAEPSLRTIFVSRRAGAGKMAGGGPFSWCFENVWVLGGTEEVCRERVEVEVHPASALGRAIDVIISLEPLRERIELRGASEGDKGYGGLCLRASPRFRGAVMTTDRGPLAEDSTGLTFRWADLSTSDLGVAVFVAPDHPGFPLPWLVRNSYAGVINPCWPGLRGAVLEPKTSVSLRYRIYVHRGDAEAGRVREAYEAYAAATGL